MQGSYGTPDVEDDYEESDEEKAELETTTVVIPDDYDESDEEKAEFEDYDETDEEKAEPEMTTTAKPTTKKPSNYEFTYHIYEQYLPNTPPKLARREAPSQIFVQVVPQTSVSNFYSLSKQLPYFLVNQQLQHLLLNPKARYLYIIGCVKFFAIIRHFSHAIYRQF